MSHKKQAFGLDGRQGAPSSNYTWRVLIAEDEALPAELLKRTLLRLGHAVVGSAQNGLEALALARQLHPDVVVMDLRMPVMDGWTAMAKLTQEMQTPVVVVSALDDRESLDQAVRAGASAFLTKPVREDDLGRALDLAVARFQDTQEIRKWRADAEQRAQEQSAQAHALSSAQDALREAQFQVVRAARRAAVASMAQGLAHEINNALTPIIGHAQMIALLYPQDPEIIDRANQITSHARQIASWLAAFRQIAVGGGRERFAFSFNGILREALEMYRERFHRLNIAVTVSLDETLPAMIGHADQMQELWMNLIQNAVEAMRGGGALRVITRYLPAENVVEAMLSDTGPGIAAEHLSRVREPGFTTKPEGAGSGMGWGLFTVDQIVKTAGGELELRGASDGAASGTTVYLRLPLEPSAET